MSYVNGIFVESSIENTLIQAIYNQNIYVIKALLKDGDDSNVKNGMSLEIAAEMGLVDIVKLLLQYGVNVNSRDDVALIKTILASWSLETSHVKIIRLLLKHGANVHARGDLALIEAVYLENIPVIETLLEHGADIHVRDDFLLKISIQRGFSSVVKLLFEHGVSISALDDGDLLRAISFCSPKQIVELRTKDRISIIQTLLENGANAYVCDELPLRLATELDLVPVVNLFLEYGADPTMLSGEYQEKLTLLIGDGEGDTKPAKK